MNAATFLRPVAAFATGALFSAGLCVSGMTRPSKVIGFLDVFGPWDASLALVMGGAVGIGLISFTWILRRPAPLFGPRFVLPARRRLDRNLLVGAAIFGLGWGLAGVCPGPALVSLVTGAPAFLVFVLMMAAGALAAARLGASGRIPARLNDPSRDD